MSEILELKDWYLRNFEKFENGLNGESNKPVHKLRKEAINKFSELSFPTVRDEDWKYTNIAPLLKFNFKPAAGTGKIPETKIDRFLFKGMNGSRLVFVNGHFSGELSNINNLPEGTILCGIEEGLKKNLKVVYSNGECRKT